VRGGGGGEGQGRGCGAEGSGAGPRHTDRVTHGGGPPPAPPPCRRAFYYTTFKMLLAPSPSRPRDLTTIMADPIASVLPVEPGADDGRRPVSLLIQRTLEVARDAAIGFLEGRGMRVASMDTVMWVLTVPAIWDDEGKAFMRRAAFEAGEAGRGT
jgi:hypothetical protein